MVGERYGKLTVKGRERGRHWRCVCDCGTAKTVRGDHLREGRVVSCGCFRRGRRTKGNRTHGHSKTPEYRAWLGIKRRAARKSGCYAGVSMAPEWAGDFETFLRDVGPKPDENATIDRIDSSRGYVPGNVRWATWTEQARNRSTNRLVTAFGETMVLADWAERAGVSRCTLAQRLARGWAPEEAVTTPVRSKREEAIAGWHRRRGRVG